MNPPKAGTLRVPGANLYYKVRGSGPFLLILQGGDGDADGCDGLVGHLVDELTVVTYDRRGLSHSTVDEGTAPPDIRTHADDAHLLLAALTAAPAFVVGFSIGALIGLELVSRFPLQVHTLVAHEAPVLPWLPDAERADVVSALDAVDETERREGAMAAMRKDMALLRMDFNDREPDVVLPRPPVQRPANLEFFRKHDAPASHRYEPEIGAVTAAATRIVAAVGRTSRGIWPYRATEVLANLVGTDLTEFPGGHNGFVLHPRAFAARLREVLGGSPRLDHS